MNIIWTIAIGFVVGLVARAVLPGKDTAGFALTTVLGISGALVGSLIGRALGLYAQGDAPGVVMSVLGAVGLLALYRYLVFGRSLPKRT
ncbi:MAG: GlsB/YeaQ/YmgE family stress response membrane protein [Pseudomonadota bacterium]|jgi:uncharacterized membrane protein YeaQ/YmgE (transglycosylase-associated protein family)